MDDVPWVKLLEGCTSDEYRQNFLAFECTVMGTVIAIERATNQVLPALKFIKNETAAGTLELLSPTGVAGAAVMKRVSMLLDMIEPPTEFPSLRVDTVKMGNRLHGEVVTIFAKVSLGTAIEERLTAVTIATAVTAATAVAAGGEESQDDHIQSRSSRHDNDVMTSATTTTTTIPGGPLDHCEVRVFVDGERAHTISVNNTFPPSSSSSPKSDVSNNSGNGGSSNQGLTFPILEIQAAFPVVYRPRCSESPIEPVIGRDAKERAAGAAGVAAVDKQTAWWDYNVEASELERWVGGREAGVSRRRGVYTRIGHR